MGLFKPAENTMAFLKMGLMGEAGSGKTHTATLIGIGLLKYLKAKGIAGSDRPAFMLDTENGSSWIKPMFDEAGIPLLVAKTRAFKDLVPAVREAEKSASLLFIDSITHFWQDLQDSYLKAQSERRGRAITALEFQDWAYIKRRWGEFSDAFVSSNLHCILCGRLGWEYEQTTNERGKKEIEKSGVKMQAEKGLGYEPNILVWMERNMDLETRQTARTATVLKDRSRKLDGKQFPNPTFQTFLPHIEFMALGGKHETPDVGRDSADTMPDDAPLSDMKSLRRQIALDEIQALLVEHHPSTSAEDKKAKASLIKEFFGTTSWTEIEKLMPLVDLQSNFDKLHRMLTGKPSRYGMTEAQADDAKVAEKSLEADADHLTDLINTNAQSAKGPDIADLKADLEAQTSRQDLDAAWSRWAKVFAAADDATREVMRSAHAAAKVRLAARKLEAAE